MPTDPPNEPITQVTIPVDNEVTPLSQALILPRDGKNGDSDRLRQAFSEEQITQEVERVQASYKYKICGKTWVGEDGALSVCKRSAGRETHHKGEGYCARHGGGIIKKSGLYSEYLQNYPTLQSIFEETQAREEQIKGLNEEIGIARSLLSGFLEELQPVNKQGLDSGQIAKLETDKINLISRVLTVIEAIRKLVDTHAGVSQKNQLTVTFEGFNMALWCIQRIISEEVTDTALQAKIFSRIATDVRLTTLPGV